MQCDTQALKINITNCNIKCFKPRLSFLDADRVSAPKVQAIVEMQGNSDAWMLLLACAQADLDFSTSACPVYRASW